MTVEKIVDAYPLSPMQQGMLFHSLHAPRSGIYLQQLMCILHENLNVSAFKQAWQRVIERHPLLRTRFRWEGINQPLQEVYSQITFPWEEQDWRNVSMEEWENQLATYLRADRQRGFELTTAPLMRLALFRMAETDYRFIWTSHHALLDGRSRLLILKELFTLYEGFCQGQDRQLESPRPYRDYIAWLEKQDWTKAEEFWRRTLKGFTAPTPLIIDRTHRTTSNEGDQGRQTIRLSEVLTAKLQSLAHQYHLTLNTLLQGAWALLLSRYSGEEEVVFGATRACRRSALEGAESMVGLFINTLPIRVRVSPGRSLLPWLQELRAQWVALRDYEHTPLVQVQGWSDLPPGKPLFESILVFENYLLNSALRVQGESWTHREFQLLGTTNYPLTVTGYLAPELLLEIAYDPHRFADATITRMLGHVQTLLEGMVTNPKQCLSAVPMLTDQEHQQLLIEWNNTVTTYPQDQCIHHLFEAQVEQTPEAIAVIFANQQFTYRELNRRANQLAHYLRKHGVGPEVLVGLCLERSLEMLIALLGILKAGGAYVPLDPTYPPERLAFMLRDTQAPLLVTQSHLLPYLPTSGIQVVCLDTDAKTLTQERAENPRSTVTAENVAYVIYTSGSTGTPKGVSIIHRSVVRLVKETHYANLTAAEVFLQFAPLSFDASTFEIWGCLLNGARLVVFPSYTLSVEELGRMLQHYQVTTLWLTAGLFHLMVEEHLESLRSVRQLLAGGDVLPVSPVQKVLQELRSCHLINGYGPTESTTFTCCYPVLDPEQLGLSVPIGRPIANTQVYILDHHLQPVPVGVPGELYIGGDGLARGYLHQPELTAEQFLPHPFTAKPGARLYRTGDLARYRSDGTIEFLGRRDQQVKIRGFRIELGEIETVLDQHPDVRETVVLASEDIPGDKRLVAYVVPEQAQPPTHQNLRRFLQEKLPPYMIPAAFVLLETFPLTPNGKVNRRALPTPDSSSLEREDTFVTPQTPVEELIAGIWTEVLGLDQVGVQENFFALGGHSLLMTQVISRLRQLFQVEISLQSLFDAPTVADQARLIERAHRVHIPPLLPTRRDRDLPLSFAQQRLWFLNQLEQGSFHYHIARALRLRGGLNMEALHQALDAIVRRHEALRTTFVAVEGQPVQVITEPRSVALPVIDFRAWAAAERESEVQRFCVQETQCPFNLSSEIMLRATLLQLDEKEHVLLLTLHHIASDGWSMSVLFRELSVLYDAFATGKVPALPELPIQYADFAVWQRQWLQGEILEAQLTYWKQQLTGAPPMFELPTDRPRSAIQRFRGAYCSFEISPSLTEALKKLSHREGVTLFMTLLAAFQTLLYRYSGQEDILIGSPIAGRNRPEIEGLIGFFVNTLVLRTYFSDTLTFRELLTQVREVCLGAYAHQDLPFEKLVEEIQPARSLNQNPLFQVMFVLQNTPQHPLKFPGLTVISQDIDSETAKFDLTLSLVEEKEGIRGLLKYNTTLFDPPTITRMGAHFQQLLERIVTNPDQPTARLPFLTETERHQLLVEWNQTHTDYPKESCIHELFEAQVECTPDAVAVVFEDEHLTYRELNARANQLAHYLQRLGVGPEVCVGLCVERSLEMVVGLLGILKAGGAYVPLDPSYPKDRLAFILEDTRVPVVLTQQQLIERIPEHKAQLVCLDTTREVMARECAENPVSGVTTDNLAYVLYTSGSTGQPKGVTVAHQQLINYSCAILERLQLQPGSSFAMVQPLTVDSCLTVIFPTFMIGGALHMISREQAIDPQALGNYFRRYLIDCLKIAPSHLAALQAWGQPELLMPRRCLVIGGEESKWEWVQSLQSLAPHCTIFNHYGPTETTVGVLTYRLEAKQSLQKYVTTPLGRPIANTQSYILDSGLQLVPVGVPGELYISGANLARGYLNHPEMTAERFIPNPFSAKPGERLYKTGDRARYLPDGNIEFLGRLDHQVKIRGFRIELGEIEMMLNQHRAVQKAAVLVREDAPGDKQLVAYLVLHQKPEPTNTELQRFLKEKLPEYMVPSAFVILDALPLTPHGKLDRRALPAPDRVRADPETDFIAPRTSIELLMAEIWQEGLGVDRVGVYDNFFELGGDSIISIQIVAKAMQAGLRLTPKHIFQYQTIAELAAVVDTAKTGETEQGLVMGSVPLTPIQHLFFEQDLLDPHHWNQAMLLEVRQPVDPVLLERVVHALLLHHDALRLRFTQGTDGWHQGYAIPPEVIPFSRVDLSELSGSEQEADLRAEAAKLQASLNLSERPLIRVTLFDLGAHKPSRLLIIIHHLVVDGVSWRILLEDLQTAYQQLSQGKPIQLPPKTTSFQHWAKQLIGYAQSPTLHQELTYWLAESRIRISPLPTDHVVGSNTVASARRVSVSLSIEETRALLQEIPEVYHTQINDVLLTALLEAFCRWTHRDSLFLELEGHGREDIINGVDLSRTVGWFTTLFPVLLRLEKASDPGETLKSVKEQLRRIPQRGIGYGVLRYLSRDQEIAEQLRTLPQPEVSFNYLGQFDQVWASAALFAWAREDSGPTRSLRGCRRHLLTITGRIVEGQLQVDWIYSERRHQRATIEHLAQDFMEALRALMTYCQSPEAGGYTPSDFPEAGLSQQELDDLMAKLQQ